MKRNSPEKSIFASLLETISDTLTKTVENIEKQKLEDINGDEDGDKASQTTITTTTEKEAEVTTEAPETTSRYIGGGRRHEEIDVLDTSDDEVTNANSTGGNEFIEGKKSNGDRIEADTSNDEENIEDEEKSEEDEFVDYSNDGDWTPLSPHGRLVVRKI